MIDAEKSLEPVALDIGNTNPTTEDIFVIVSLYNQSYLLW